MNQETMRNLPKTRHCFEVHHHLSETNPLEDTQGDIQSSPRVVPCIVYKLRNVGIKPRPAHVKAPMVAAKGTLTPMAIAKPQSASKH